MHVYYMLVNIHTFASEFLHIICNLSLSVIRLHFYVAIHMLICHVFPGLGHDRRGRRQEAGCSWQHHSHPQTLQLEGLKVGASGLSLLFMNSRLVRVCPISS